MDQIVNITHPLGLETKVLASKPRCSCKGGGTEQVIGVIKKVIPSNGTTWYYLSNGISVQDKWVIRVL